METFPRYRPFVREFTGLPAQRPMTRKFDVFFDLRLNKRLRKQSWGWWFKTLSRPLWHHCNRLINPTITDYPWSTLRTSQTLMPILLTYHNWEAAPRDTNLQGGDIFVVNICVDIYSYKNCILQQTHKSFYLNIWKRFAVTNDNEVHISSARKK